MFDKLVFDQAAYPNTRYLANILLTTGPGYTWCLDFFDWARREVGAKRISVEEALEKFSELGEQSIAKQGALLTSAASVDWQALFIFIEENTRLTSLESRRRNPQMAKLFGEDVLELRLQDER